MTSTAGWLDGPSGSGSSWRDEPRESGARRRKLAGYLRAANELRQTYQQAYMEKWNVNDGTDDDFNSLPGSYPSSRSAASAKHGEHELILFPSYARNHVKHKPRAAPGTIQEAPGVGRDVRDSVGTGDAEYWRQQWDRYEEDNAIVDVDVRGWIYFPQRGPLNRKNRLFVGLARQMVGIPATGNSPSASTASSRSSSPHGFRQKVEAHNAKHEEEIVAKEAESLMIKGEVEADAAHKGAYSEEPWRDESPPRRLQRTSAQHQPDDAALPSVQPRPSWNSAAQMSNAEIAEANKHLMSRLKPFLANPMAYTPISAFFYNDESSRQKTIDTDAYGHFNLRAALDFIPTHVRILTSEGLSATEEVNIVPSAGVSVISDIDDTIKHSAITSGAREIFRNVFVRDLRDLYVQGVKEWYGRLEGEGVTFHYVSNSPWQLYPLLQTFFAQNELPKGSFHLKQYSGMLQGIFEPVAERKKGTLERIIRDFPDRRFLLIGDSGEADLEVYTDIVLENPGRVLGVFIRDITTTGKTEFFDSTAVPRQGLPPSSNAQRSDVSSKASNGPNQADSARAGNGKQPPLPPRPVTEQIPLIEEDLIDLSSDVDEPVASKVESKTSLTSQPEKAPPTRPPKPGRLSSASVVEDRETSIPRKPAPPPVPSKPSRSVAPTVNLATKPTPQSSITQSKPAAPGLRPKERPPVPPKQLSYRSAAREKLSAAYNSLPSASSYLNWTDESKTTQQGSEGSNGTTASNSGLESEGNPPPLPSRKPGSSSATSSLNGTSLNKSSSLDPPDDGSSAPKLNHYNTFPISSNQQTEQAPYAAPNRKEELWRRRWARARAILESKGVVLQSWRVGGDIADEVLKLVEQAHKDTLHRK